MNWKIINEGWFGILAGLAISIVLGIYFHRRARARTALTVRMVHVPVIAPLEDNDRLEVRYDGVPVPRVTRSVVGYWNSGNQVIRGADVSRLNPLAVRTTQGREILQADRIAWTRDVNGVEIELIERSEAFFGFDFLNPGDGFTLEIVHTGDYDQITATGTIQGMDGEVGGASSASRYSELIGRGLLASMMFTVVTFMIGLIGGTLYTAWEVGYPGNLPMLSVALLVLVAGLWGVRIDRNSNRIPGAPKLISDSLTSRLTYPGKSDGQPHNN